jgi:hypothetical protein
VIVFRGNRQLSGLGVMRPAEAIALPFATYGDLSREGL